MSEMKQLLMAHALSKNPNIERYLDKLLEEAHMNEDVDAMREAIRILKDIERDVDEYIMSVQVYG